MFSLASMNRYSNGSMIGIIPSMGIKEYLDKLKNEEYDPNHIYKVWEEMAEDPDTLELMNNNIKCGVCADGYMTNSCKEVSDCI